MTTRDPNLDHAKDLISTELPRYLGPLFDIHRIVAGTFHHDDEDLETISKPELPLAAVPEQGARQLDQAHVVGGLLVVAHQYRPAFR